MLYIYIKGEKRFLQVSKIGEFPDSFASNIARCVNANEGKILGLKSHDCHVLLQRLIPIGIRAYLRKDVCTPLIELSNFFQEICAKTLNVQDLEKLEEGIVLILCKLEIFFPPAFFDVMVHLVVHLPYEAKLVGPVSYSWMYPIERNLGKLKRFVKNKAHPEGSIAEGYIVNDLLTFCSMYLRGIETKFNRDERNDDGSRSSQNAERMSIFSQKVRPFGATHFIQYSQQDINSAHWYVLNNCEELKPYID
ncbi:hypothetical protein Ddye_028602 [Dipteronia dyeriana]|uniref:DUF4218 domain-containing protein n=1 Tax=Dipteronia dyeriana TaxID=168575 RepID=A0AAD9WKU3_9ROSI|nr:hypothetical protein Ddye_028602 [Dipteronia dyeriana]